MLVLSSVQGVQAPWADINHETGAVLASWEGKAPPGQGSKRHEAPEKAQSRALENQRAALCGEWGKVPLRRLERVAGARS